MRVESQRPYGLPNLLQEAKETAADKVSKAPEKAVNSSGDQFELSAEQKVTQDILAVSREAGNSSELTPQRAAEIKGKISSGYYLSSGAAEETAKALTSFHR